MKLPLTSFKFRLKAHIQQASAVSPSLLTEKKILATAEFKAGMGIINCISFKKQKSSK